MLKIKFLVIALLIFFFSSILSRVVYSQDVSITPASNAASSTPAEEIRYELPYPGLLPNNPLYFLKVTRDKIISLLISDPLKKSEFNLLQADKRLNAGFYLSDSAKGNKKKLDLAVSTVSKGENYFGQAIEKLKEAKMQSMVINEISQKLLTSSRKHQEVIKMQIGKTKGKVKQSFEKELGRVRGFEKEAMLLMPKK